MNAANQQGNKKYLLLNGANIRTYTMVFALIVIAIMFQILTRGIFFAPRNLSNLFRSLSIIGVLAMGMVLLIVSGNFDLAVGSALALTGGIAAVLQVWFGMSTPVAILAAVVVGVLIGLWQGFWVAYRKVPSFIVTLGNMMALRGLYLVITQGLTINHIKDDFLAISQSYLPNILNYIVAVIIALGILVYNFQKRSSRAKYGFTNEKISVTIIKILVEFALVGVFIYMMVSFRGIPTPVIILIAVVLIFTFIAQKTRFGRRVYAIGGNMEAAKLTGINVNKHVLILYVISGILSAISGIMLTSRLGSAVAVAGTSYEMDVISACVIGGTSLVGGKGTMFGAIIGVLIIACLDNGMSLLNITYYYQNIVKGLVLIIAVWFDVANQKKGK
ncbi:xylose ABC transporter permease [Spirochaetia bacterium]|nr:xylose ABC transporter permease [Spirochaetia bacterium]